MAIIFFCESRMSEISPVVFNQELVCDVTECTKDHGMQGFTQLPNLMFLGALHLKPIWIKNTE